MNVAKQQIAICLVGWTSNQKLKLAGNLSVAMFFYFFFKNTHFLPMVKQVSLKVRIRYQ